MAKIVKLSAAQTRSALPQLAELLQDSLASGASVGFLPPLNTSDAESYWRETAQEVESGERLLLAAYEDGALAGTAQLALALKPNAQHRAEVQKLLVHTSRRGRGVAGELMAALETEARAAGRSLLVLDTERGSVAEKLYPRYGYTQAGVIPRYALRADGSFCDTVVFYRLL
jgi:GNAT superfamily N-acetyltransferase